MPWTEEKLQKYRQALAGAAAALQTNPGLAEKIARAIIEEAPDIAEAHRLLGSALRLLGRKAEGEKADTAAIEAAAKRPELVAAQRAMDKEDFEAAELSLRTYLRLDAAEPGALRLLALIATRCDAAFEAEKMLRRALAVAPGYDLARVNLATVLVSLNRGDEALAEIQHVLDRNPENLAALAFKGRLLVESRRLDEAAETFSALLHHQPEDSARWMNFGYLMKTMGRIDEGVAAYRRSVELNPANGNAWWGMANLKTLKFDAADVAQMQCALAQADEESRVHFHFALGKAFRDLGRFEESFAHYEQGNCLHRKRISYDSEFVTADVRKAEALFNRNFFESRANCGTPTREPLFIVSLPRSGSTLVEQIISSHPMVEGTEELFDIQNIAKRLVGAKGMGSHWQDNLGALSCDELYALGTSYMTTTARRRQTDRPFFTDKMPGNWAYLPLILSILPNAKIVDVRRHPMSCGFANFAQYFNWGVTYSYDLSEIGYHYRDYARMMDHFDKIMPGRIHRVVYENLVEDLNSEVQRLLDYLELPFDAACLRFHENPRAVHTPSSEQVRRPINREGMEGWKSYEPWLDPLKEALGSVLASYPRAPEQWRD